jgi:hypothetical protein
METTRVPKNEKSDPQDDQNIGYLQYKLAYLMIRTYIAYSPTVLTRNILLVGHPSKQQQTQNVFRKHDDGLGA